MEHANGSGDMTIDATYQSCARVVAQAIYKIPGKRIGIHDEDDLTNELMISALRAAEKADGRPGMGYVRTSVANAVKELYRHALAAMRHPQDCYGRPVWFANPDVLAWQVDDRFPDPEAMAAARQKIEWLVARLPPEDRALVERAASGEIELDPSDAERIRYSGARGYR